jgi:YD repeat-containing protein
MSRLNNVFKTLVAMLALSFALGAAAAQYTYDQLGRVTSVVESDGSSITYTYDANGNMTSKVRTGATQPLTLISFAPAMGVVGSTVVIRGTGFLPVPAQNTVTFNGVTANVISANASTIVTTVPVGATTGPISVTTAAGTATSAGSFAVVTVQITDFTPTIGAVGTSVTINGIGFDATPANNVVKFNTTSAVVSTATTTQLTVPVPTGATAGHISVTTPTGSAVSAGDFIVPPPGYSAGQFETAGRLNWPGSGLVFTVNSPSKLGIALFDGAQGQRLSLVLTNLSMNGSFKIFAPDGTVIRSGSLTTGVGVLELGPLSATGTYSFVMIPTYSAGSVTVRLVPELLGTLQTDGTPRPTTLVMSQNARFTFNVVAGESYNFAMTNFVAAPANTNLYAVVYRADGSTVANCPYQVAGASSCHFTATETATYTLFLDAPDQSAATFDGRLNVDFRVTLLHGVPNGVSLDKPGRNATLSFSVAAGEDVALNIAPIVTAPVNGVGMFRVFTASGTQVSANYISGSTLTINLKGLAAGNYNAVVFFNDAATATFTATMAKEMPTALSTNGTTVTRTAVVPAQYLFYTFPGTAGQNLGIGLSNAAFVSGASGATYVKVLRPDGTAIWASGCIVPGRCQISLRNLPSTGTYRLEMYSDTPDKFGVGVTVSPSIAGTLTVDTPLNLNFASSGQNAVLTFTTSSTQTLALMARSMSFNPAGSPLLFSVFNAAGSQVATANGTATASATMTNLPAGTYTVTVESTAAATGSVQMLLSSGTPIATDGTSVSFSSGGGGEKAYYTFAGTAGQNIGVGLTGLSLTPASPGNIYVTVYKPDGSTLAAAGCYPSMNTGCQLTLRGLPATGTYRIEVSPGDVTQTMTFTLRLSQAIGGAISPSATPLTLNFGSAGQYAQYTFTATAGKYITLRVDPTSIAPVNSELVLRVYNPTGTQIGVVAVTTTGATINLTNLAAGTYTVTIVPTYAATGQAQFKLLPGMTGTLATNGTSTNYTAGAPGQVGYFSFSGTAGQSLGLGITNVAIAPSSFSYYSAVVYKPDGSVLTTSNNCYSTNSGCQVPMNALPTTGTYRVQVSAGEQASINFTLTLSKSLGGAKSPSNTAMPINFNVPGSYARYTLTAAAGGRLTVALAPPSMSPANSEVTLRVYNPSGTLVQNLAVTTVGVTANMIDLVAGTYSIVVAPTYAATGTTAVTIATPPTIALVVNGTSANLTSAVAGQTAYLTFSGTAGQNLNLGMTGLALSPNAQTDVLILRILKPDNSVLLGATVYTTNPGAAFALLNLPSTGTYRVEASPGSQQTFTAKFGLSSGMTGTLAAGTPLSLTLPASGSFAWISFTTSATQTVPITIGSLATTPAGSQVSMQVYNPSGTAVSPQLLTTTSPATLTLPGLPAGTYSIFVQPSYAATGSFQLSRP